MELTVVIVNWNTRDLVLRCLGHLGRMELGVEHEIWVVDNGSEDGSVEAVRSTFPGVNLLENSQNMGFARANNLALQRSRGRYVLLLNTDCFPQEGATQRLIQVMEADPKVGIAGGELRHADGRRQNAFGAAPTLVTELFPKGLLQVLFPRRFPSKRRPPEVPVEVEAVRGAFLLVRRAAWVALGGFDEGYFFFLEETDWCLRMRRAGWKVLHVPGAAAVHLQGRSAALDGAGARVEYHRSLHRFFLCHRGRASATVLRYGLLLKVLVNWVSSGLMSYVAGVRGGRWMKRHLVDRTLIRWYLQGCPEGQGLPREPQNRVRRGDEPFRNAS